MDPGERGRAAHDYTSSIGFETGFPNFHEAMRVDGVVYGLACITPGSADHRSVSKWTLGGAANPHWAEMMRAANDYAAVNGYPAAFPTFHEALTSSGNVAYGIILLKAGTVDFRDVPLSDLQVADPEDFPAMMRAANDYAATHGYAAGFPTMHKADYGQGLVCGLQLIKAPHAQVRDVLSAVMHIATKFTFDQHIPVTHRRRIVEAHTIAYDRIFNCSRLSNVEKYDLRAAYGRAINHTWEPDHHAIASARIGGWYIIYRDDLLTMTLPDGSTAPRPADKVAAVLIHEMMHNAGYDHPAKREPDPSDPNKPYDKPGDGGPYFSSKPEQAELCIAGTHCDEFGNCTVSNGLHSYGLKSAVKITFIRHNPKGPDLSGEYVLIRNTGNLEADLDRWTLSDKARHVYRFKQIKVPPGKALTVWTKEGVDTTENVFWGRKAPVWNNTGDTAILADANGVEVSRLTY